MACTSGSVQTVADKTVAAKSQIDKLQSILLSQDSAVKASFYSQIDAHLADSNIHDALEVSYAVEIKTEYTSEFSLDRIAAVVASALKVLGKLLDPSIKSPATSPDAIAAYIDVVNAVAEAAKSSSTSSASLAFSMNRLSPGVYAFLYATSANIKDADTFGTEAVTTTAIYYRVIQSIDDIKNTARFGAALCDMKSLLNMKALQAALTDDLAAGKINIDEWLKKDDLYSVAVKRIEDRLATEQFDKTKPLVLSRSEGFGAPVNHSFVKGSPMTQAVAQSAIQRLSVMGSGFKTVIDKTQTRLKGGYF